MAFGDEDLDALFDDMGVSVSMGTYTTKALKDSPDEMMTERGNPGAIGSQILLTLKTGALPGLAVGSAITVAGVAMKVRERMTLDDGALTRISCGKA